VIFRRRRRAVHKLMDENYWDGFFCRLGDGLGPGRCFEYTEGPTWWNDVAGVAYSAGWTYADDVIAKLGTRRFGSTVSRDIPARVVAGCYAAARLA
jgi:hypothetical protein